MAEDAEGLHRNWGGGGCEMLWGQPPARVRPWARLWVRGSAAQGLPGPRYSSTPRSCLGAIPGHV